MKIYFFDTETTGTTQTDCLCQLAVKEQGIAEPIINALYKPPVAIPFESSMIHHITNKMVADKPAFKDAPEYDSIKTLFESPDTIVVAHNATFDEQILKNDGITPTNTICTFKVIRILDAEGKFPMHKLQYLRYALDMDINVPAHDAFGDVIALERLFTYEMEQAKVKWNMNEEEVLVEMMRITNEPITFHTINFGKHNGKSIKEIAAIDRGYLEWLLKQKRENPQNETDWIYTLEKALGI